MMSIERYKTILSYYINIAEVGNALDDLVKYRLKNAKKKIGGDVIARNIIILWD